MDVAVIGTLIPIILTLGAFIMVGYIRKFQNLERMAMIEKGLNVDFFKNKNDDATSGALRASLLLVGAGLGLLLGYWMDKSWGMEEVGYFSMILILGGTGLGLAYWIEEKKKSAVK
jgi:predicted MFS family arabinose efflux permease